MFPHNFFSTFFYTLFALFSRGNFIVDHFSLSVSTIKWAKNGIYVPIQPNQIYNTIYVCNISLLMCIDIQAYKLLFYLYLMYNTRIKKMFSFFEKKFFFFKKARSGGGSGGAWWSLDDVLIGYTLTFTSLMSVVQLQQLLISLWIFL